MRDWKAERTVPASDRTLSVRARRAFTLVELMVVVTIIGILAAALLTGLRSGIGTTHFEGTRAVLGQIAMAIQQYKDLRGVYPAGAPISARKLAAELGPTLVVKSTFYADTNRDGVADTLMDPWEHPIVYTRYLDYETASAGHPTTEGIQPIKKRRTYDLFSAGPVASEIAALGGAADLASFQAAALQNDRRNYKYDGLMCRSGINKFIGNW